MKVQTKLILLLALVVASFLVALWAFRSYDRSKFRHIADQRFAERNRSFEEFLQKHGEKLETLAYYDSASDQLIEAIARDDRAWFEQNVTTQRLESFAANAAWVYRPDGTLAYRVNNLGDPNLGALPVPAESIPQIFGPSQLAHFFVALPEGRLMEIRGAAVQPAQDVERIEEARGYFFVGRLWSQPVLDEMSMFTGNTVSLGKTGENYTDEYGQLAFSKTLRAWDGRPLRQLIVRNESPVVQELRRMSERFLVALILFALTLFLLLTLFLNRWVRRPLRLIMKSLQRSDPEPIAGLARKRSEFGELARTVRMFFQHRDNLLREMEERRATEDALRQSEEALRQSQKMEAVGRLAGGIAHDFNNLLTAIIGYAELILSRDGTEPVLHQHADSIRKAGEQAATLTRQLLAFSRKQLLQPRVIDLNQLVADMEKLLHRVIGERYQIKTRPEAGQATVMADPSQIEQVILNLSVNARDAMPAGGQLTIRTANVHLDQARAAQISSTLTPGDYVELTVTDTGIGMDEETQSHIFEPFFTTKGPGKGTGLGLATVYGIVNQSGGAISVESAPHQGATFCVFLPLERAPVAPPRPAPAPVERSQNFETVLVVEDEDIVRELVCDSLAEEGFHVLCAGDGHEAMEQARQFDGPIHLLVTDVIMPGMNGPELAAQLTALRPDLKVLYVSGYSANDIGDHGVLDPQVDLLQKPFTPQTLARKIRDVMQEPAHVSAGRE